MLRRIREFARAHVVARLRTRYTLALEDEVVRLRAENHALVNSIFGIAGIPPVLDVGNWRQEAGKSTADGIPVKNAQEAGGPEGRPYENDRVAPLRRRSWQQIGRALEIGDARAARHERESDTDAFPAPRNVVPRA